MSKVKVSFDIHGVLDDLPKVFVAINNALFDAGHEIHIVTGSPHSGDLIKKLKDLGVKFHYFFSILDYCKQTGQKITYDENGQGWVEKDIWDKTKAEYCKKVGMDLHFDDSDVYVDYFTTPYARVFTKNNNGGADKPIIR